MNDFDRIFTYAFPLLFVGFWLFITTLLRRIAGMTRELRAPAGPPVRESRWGSASINGVAAKSCAKVVEYSDGYVVRMMWIFGGGQMWLPKADLHIGAEVPKRFLVPRNRTIISGLNRVVLLDHLVDVIS